MANGTATAEQAVVSVRRCATYSSDAIEPALDRLLADLGGLDQFVKPGQRVLLKPNLIAALPPENAATTHPALVESVARRVLALGATPFIADSPAWGGRETVGRATGMAAVAERLGIEWLVLDRQTRLRSAWPAVASSFHVDPRVLAADVVINCGKFKAHQQLGFCAATKNLYGTMAGREKALHHFTRSRNDGVFARYLVAFGCSLPVALHIVDGVEGMEGPGPRLGRPRPLNWLAASTDPLAVDRVCADLVSAPETHRLMLTAARELGVQTVERRYIALRGDPPDALTVDDYVWPALLGVFFSPWRLVRGWWKNRSLLAAER